jgi:hypothetical protein
MGVGMLDDMLKKDPDPRKFEGVATKIIAESLLKASQQQNSGDKK